MGSLLDIEGPRAGFDDGVHGVRVDFQDPVHLFQAQDDAAQGRDGAVGHTRAGAARRDRDHVLVGQLQDRGDLFRRGGPDDDFGTVHERRVRLFVGLETLQRLFVGFDVGRADRLLQFLQDFRGHGIVLRHNGYFLPLMLFLG